MKTQPGIHRIRVFAIVLVAGLLFQSPAKADPCGIALTIVSPPLGAAFWAMKAQHQAAAQDHYTLGMGQGAPGDNADHQITAREAANVAKEGAAYNMKSIPMFIAGQAIAMAKMMFVQATTLGICIGRRSAQGAAQTAAAKKNDYAADFVMREDPVKGPVGAASLSTQPTGSKYTTPSAVSFAGANIIP